MDLQKLSKREKKQPTGLLHNHDGENGGRRVSHEDIELVQNLIESCLLRYMTKNEVVTLLAKCVKIEPHFITLVWRRLEEENPEFFSAYNVQLILKKQIILFNQLLEKQYQMTKSREYCHVPQPSLHDDFRHMPANSSYGLLLQQPYPPSTGATDMAHGSAYPVADGVPAMCNVYPTHQNVDAATYNHEMDIGSYDSFSFELNGMQRSSVQPMTFGATFPSNMYGVEGFQHVLDGGSGVSFDSLGSHVNLTTNLINDEDLAALCQSSLISNFNTVDTYGESHSDTADFFIADPPCLESRFRIDEKKSYWQ